MSSIAFLTHCLEAVPTAPRPTMPIQMHGHMYIHTCGSVRTHASGRTKHRRTITQRHAFFVLCVLWPFRLHAVFTVCACARTCPGVHTHQVRLHEARRSRLSLSYNALGSRELEQPVTADSRETVATLKARL